MGRSRRTSSFRSIRAVLPLLALTWLLAGIGMAQPVASAAAPGDPGRAVMVAPDACFRLEDLSPEDRALGERWLLEVMDKEALFTVASELKPASLAFVVGRISVDEPTSSELEDFTRAVRILSTWRCGDLGAAVLAGTVVVEGKRVLHGVIFRRSLVRSTVKKYAAVFGAAGIIRELSTEQILATAELTPPPLRHRLWGHLLGYPAYAVDFFARADEQQRSQGSGGVTSPIVPRDFFSVPTYARETNHFVWAVPKGHEPSAEDLAIRAAAAPILARYRELRSEYIGEGKPGIVALLRAWLCTAAGCTVAQTALAQ